jgi:hypothetical protein
VELLLSTFTMGVGGSESYLLTVAEQLQRLGHEVTVHAMEVDDSADAAADRGIRVVSGERHLPPTCDAVLVQDSVVSLFHARRYPDAPQVFVCHSDFFDFQLPPQLPGVTRAVVVLSERVARRVRALALGHEIVRLRQPVDIGRFAPRELVSERPQRVLVLSTYKQEGRQRMIDEACSHLGLECERIGLGTAMNTRPELAMAHCDIVVGKGRVIVEAMASGRAAYVWDLNGGDGWVTPERYELLEADNFGGQAEPQVIDAERLRRDLKAYRHEMGAANRDLAVRNHSAGQHAEALVGLLERPGPRFDQPRAPLRELERVARAARSMEVRAFHLVRENDALRARLAELDADFVPGVARPGLERHAGRRARRRRWLALGRESVRDRLRWHAWRLRARLPGSTVSDLDGENEVLRRRLELAGVEREELARLLAQAVADDSPEKLIR